jgi:hypothetical protein
MPIVTVFNLTTMTPEKYDSVIAGLEDAGVGNPDGRLYHVGAQTAAGTMIVTDVWESPEKLEAFGKSLFPVLHANGVTPVEPQVTPARGIIVGK